jgi:hypothetical protein
MKKPYSIPINLSKMKKLIFIAICLTYSIMFANAADLPRGKWSVKEVTIEKNTDGKVSTTVYNSAAEVQGFLPCPQEWEITAENITLHYVDIGKTTVDYKLKGNYLTFGAVGAIHTYQYSTKGEYLTLTITYQYGNNHPEGRVEEITENWTINLIKEKE